MKINKILFSAFLSAALVASSFFGFSAVNADVVPPVVEAVIAVGESINVEKTVNTPEIPPLFDVCLLEDETGSFGDDIDELQGGKAEVIFDTIVATGADAQFAVAGFRDYPNLPYGEPGDWVYRSLSGMSSSKVDWLNGIANLTAGGGWDLPEAQYDAIVAASGPGIFIDPTLGEQDNCGWRDDPNVKRVLVVTTDAEFHVPGAGPHLNDEASTIAALNAQGITVIGLKAPGTNGELDALALATGGSVQSLSSDGSDIADAIMAGLGNLPITVTPVAVGCDPLIVTFVPVSQTVTSGDPANFIETIAVPNDPALEGTSHSCIVEFRSGDKVIGIEKITIKIPDKTPPKVMCIETVNPHGKNIPPAGSTTLPGAKGGQNEDGFYQLLAKDNSDDFVKIYVTDVMGSATFGAFMSGDRVKITQAKGAVPSMKTIGSENGQAGAVKTHIILKGDAMITAVDASGNKASVMCLVPPPPK